uniref:Tudor domain-containing protein n=1 Tax=Gadus morhua TaxID=8049 RepID=A0A8C5BYL5_GADMO
MFPVARQSEANPPGVEQGNTSYTISGILQAEIQNTPKTKASVGLGEFCLVEDLMAGLWYRGEVRNANADSFDVFLIDQGNVMSVDISQMYSCSNELLDLPPKIVCGYFSNVLPLHDCWDSVMEKYLLSLIGTHVTGYIHALLPHKVMLFEATDINQELAGRGFCKHLDADTFLLLVKMLTDVPLEQNMESGPDFYQRPWVQSDFKSFGGTDMSAGTCVQLKVTAAVNPGLFHCQVSSAASDLQAMSERLTLACNSTLSDPHRTPKDNIGLLCSVKGKDGKWYRGCLQCLPVNSNVKVLFVDYGFCESVRVENILRLPANCFSLPIMAFPCTLSSVTEQDKDCKRRQLCLLKKGILNGVLNAKVLSLDVKLNTYSIEVLSNEDCFVKEPELTQEQCLRLSVQAEVLKPGSKSVGYVVHVIDPNDFSLRTEKRNGDFEDLMSQMSEHFSQVKLNEQVLKNPQIGKMCCAMYERDMHFYRAVVKQKLDHGAVVLFIDFGNTEKVPYMLIKKIPEKFASQAAFALSCTLGNIMPLTDVWTSANIQFFKQTVLNKSLMVHVVHQSKCQIVVDLFTMEGQSDQGITDLLISYKQAEPWRYTQSESVKQVTTSWRPCKPKELCTWTQLCALTQNITPKPQVPSAFPVSFSYSSFNLGCGNKEHVYITHISDEWEIYCQLDKNSEIIEELETKISEEEEKLHGADATAPVDGMCLAKYIDGRWYRGLANPVQSSLYLNVFFVDYGNTSIVEKINVLSIPNHSAELLYTPMQAVKCTLAGVPKSEPLAWVTQWLKKTLLNELVRAVVVGKLKDGALTVELFNGDLHINNKVNEHIDNPSPKTTHGQHQDKRVSPALDASHSQHQDERVSPPLNTTHSQHQDKRVLPTLNATQCQQQDERVLPTLNATQCQQQDKRVSPTLNTTYSKPREKKVSPTINATKATQIPKMPTLSSFPETRLKPGQQALRYVSHINTVSDYFLQLQDEKTNLLNMREVLNSSVSRASLIKSTRRELEMKNNVLAEYDDDGALYRAVIKGSEQHGFKVEITTNFKDEQARLGSRQLYFAPTNMGQVYHGFAAAVISPFDFYIVREDSLLIMNEVSAMLDELPDEMPPLPEAHRVPGSCCLVYSNTKGRWCRAEVVHAETTVVINLVDYGHHIHLASYQVKVLPEALKRPPKVTYPCSLRGVNPVSDTGQWTDKAAVFFQERVCHKDLQIVFQEFVSDDRQWQVDILVDGIHLAKELVKAGHSSYSDPLLGLR